VTKFSWDEGEPEWGVKHPKIFDVGKTIKEQEIISRHIRDDRSIKKTYYDSSLRPVHSETMPPKKKIAEKDSDSTR